MGMMLWPEAAGIYSGGSSGASFEGKEGGG